MRTMTLLGLALTLALLAPACDSNEDPESKLGIRSPAVGGESAQYGDGQGIHIAETPAAMPEPDRLRTSRDASVAAPPTSSLPRPRMVIKTAQVQCEVANYDTAVIEIQRITEQVDGYIVASTVHAPDAGMKQGTVTLRIPADKFETTLQALKTLANTVETESIEGNDITEEFYDLTARLQNKRKAEQRFQEILRSAKKATEVLEIEQALMNIREDIERLEGRKRFLTDQTDMSTISMSMHEPRPLMVGRSEKFWTRLRRGFAEGVEAGVAKSVRLVSAGVAFVVGAIPFVIGLFVIFWAGRKYYSRRARRLAAATPNKPTPSSLT